MLKLCHPAVIFSEIFHQATPTLWLLQQRLNLSDQLWKSSLLAYECVAGDENTKKRSSLYGQAYDLWNNM